MTLLTSRRILLVPCTLALLAMAACSGSPTNPVSNPVVPAAGAAKYIYTLNPGANGQSSVQIWAAGTGGVGASAGNLALPANFLATCITIDSMGQIYVGGLVRFVGPAPLPQPIAEVLVYPAGATGSVTAERTILSNDLASTLAVDPSGNLYMGAYLMSVGQEGVQVYSSAATGAAAPVRTVLVPGDGGIGGLALDNANNLYVHYFDSNLKQGRALVFSSTASGSATPLRELAGLNETWGGAGGIAVSSDGHVFVSRGTPSFNTVLEFAPAGSSNNDPTVTIVPTNFQAGNPGQLAFDKAGTLYFNASYEGLNEPTGGYTQEIYAFTPAVNGTFLQSSVITVPGGPANYLAIQ